VSLDGESYVPFHDKLFIYPADLATHSVTPNVVQYTVEPTYSWVFRFIRRFSKPYLILLSASKKSTQNKKNQKVIVIGRQPSRRRWSKPKDRSHGYVLKEFTQTAK